ncbi:MAG: thioredoxin [Candidatus Methylacidiphilales bacterium]|nr:thioredoxin [Candidatus Methylacidiphilales bacterium]
MPEAPEKTEAVATLKGYDFDAEVLKTPGLVLVDFYAEWCGPCRMVAPLLEEVAKEQIGKVKVVKVDVDKQAELAQRYNVIHLPTMVFFRNGVPVDQKVGLATKREILVKIAANS